MMSAERKQIVQEVQERDSVVFDGDSIDDDRLKPNCDDGASTMSQAISLSDLNGNPIQANTEVPVPVDTENFKGQMYVKMKCEDMLEDYHEYFHGKKRTFELQVQGKFSGITEDDCVYLGVETPEYLRLGFWARMMLTLVKAFVHRIEPSSTVSLGDYYTGEVGAISFPLQESCDRLMVTPPGEEPPSLSRSDMLPEGMTKDERKMYTTYNNDDTYTLSMHGMYVDWLKWHVVNIPGVPDLHMESFCDDMPVSIVAYTLPKNHSGSHHCVEKKYIFQVKMSPNKEPSGVSTETVSEGSI
ncbi:hypothetical protein SARC_00933 [Sphaeroforma arctica JP610]|uniref:Domain of unknown function at the cortex 1 domain-containing protein n=1 Tax=Sphaeroforma arctica JP610 TaxID=667725 RepID=A0A0L0GDH1_9EUKA|nr:hypothetical protein SARC_00933 [Sphaeroforma arctica JP610]KNC86931.1 hypothetical protein SARC_00933 [Sphaeroforma arctica JP610]|eukprot:XP_014160833.1 hypothetical protein SARC_00933 [Sphaeroforma arctica JP610]